MPPYQPHKRHELVPQVSTQVMGAVNGNRPPFAEALESQIMLGDSLLVHGIAKPSSEQSEDLTRRPREKHMRGAVVFLDFSG